MTWWVDAIVTAVPYIYKGITGSKTASDQSDATANTALANAIAINSAAQVNANSILSMAKINEMNALASAKAENDNTSLITSYNVKSTLFLSEYEATLLDNEALLTAESANLDIKQLAINQAQAIGDMKVSHGASGAIMGQDSSKQSIDSALQQQEFERFVVRRGADIQIGKLQDAAAISRWQGQQTAGKIALEGQIIENNNTTGALLKNLNTAAQAGIDADSIMKNAAIQSGQTITTGNQVATYQSGVANSALYSGIFGAGTSVASSYIQEKAKEDSTDLLAEG